MGELFNKPPVATFSFLPIGPSSSKQAAFQEQHRFNYVSKQYSVVCICEITVAYPRIISSHYLF